MSLLRTVPESVDQGSMLLVHGMLLVQGGVTHIGAVQIAVTGVKTWSNGQATLRGAVKQSSGRFCHLYCTVNGQD